jgi:hypothetical protein
MPSLLDVLQLGCVRSGAIPHASPSDAPRAKPAVVQAAWALVAACPQLDDPELASFAGDLLALVGPHDPLAVAFRVPAGAAAAATAAQPSLPRAGARASAPADGAPAAKGKRKRGADGGAAAAAAAEPAVPADALVVVLSQLADYLVDPEVRLPGDSVLLSV